MRGPRVTAIIKYTRVSPNVTSQNFGAFDLSSNLWPGIDEVTVRELRNIAKELKNAGVRFRGCTLSVSDSPPT